MVSGVGIEICELLLLFFIRSRGIQWNTLIQCLKETSQNMTKTADLNGIKKGVANTNSAGPYLYLLLGMFNIIVDYNP